MEVRFHCGPFIHHNIFQKNMDFSQTNLLLKHRRFLKKGISELKAKEKERAAYEAAEKLESMATCILIVTCGFEALYAVALYVFAQNPTRYEYRCITHLHRQIYTKFTYIVECYEILNLHVALQHRYKSVRSSFLETLEKIKNTTNQLPHHDRSRQTMTRRKTRCVTKWLKPS